MELDEPFSTDFAVAGIDLVEPFVPQSSCKPSMEPSQCSSSKYTKPKVLNQMHLILLLVTEIIPYVWRQSRFKTFIKCNAGCHQIDATWFS